MSIFDFEKPSLTERAYEEIRKNILVGKMPPGHKLVVNDLVEEWKISATPIKEALNRLVSEELVEVVPRRGMRVRMHDAVSLKETFEIRILYETYCCSLAVERIDERPEIAEELNDTLVKTKAIMNDDMDYMMQYHLDVNFHMLLASLSNNKKLMRDFDRLHANIMSFGIYASKKARLWRQVDSYHEHQAIYDALVERSSERMVEAMRTHLITTRDDLLRFFHPQSGRFLHSSYSTDDSP